MQGRISQCVNATEHLLNSTGAHARGTCKRVWTHKGVGKGTALTGESATLLPAMDSPSSLPSE